MSRFEKPLVSEWVNYEGSSGDASASKQEVPNLWAIFLNCTLGLIPEDKAEIYKGCSVFLVSTNRGRPCQGWTQCVCYPLGRTLASTCEPELLLCCYVWAGAAVQLVQLAQWAGAAVQVRWRDWDRHPACSCYWCPPDTIQFKVRDKETCDPFSNQTIKMYNIPHKIKKFAFRFA